MLPVGPWADLRGKLIVHVVTRLNLDSLLPTGWRTPVCPYARVRVCLLGCVRVCMCACSRACVCLDVRVGVGVSVGVGVGVNVCVLQGMLVACSFQHLHSQAQL